MCHLGRLTGVLSVGSGPRVAELRFREGEIVSAQAGGRSGEEAVLELLAWPEGHFSFAPGAPGPEAPLGSFNQILLDACRRLRETPRREERPRVGGLPARPAPRARGG